MSASGWGIKQQYVHSLNHWVGTIAPHQIPAQGPFSKGSHKNVTHPACLLSKYQMVFGTQAANYGTMLLILYRLVIPDT